MMLSYVSITSCHTQNDGQIAVKQQEASFNVILFTFPVRLSFTPSQGNNTVPALLTW